MQQPLLQLGVNITLFGMGIVFVFLLLLALCTGAMSRFVTRYFPVIEPMKETAGQADTAQKARIRKIIQLAIAQHRKKR
ncbi:MAG: OadG family protein [Gammaproteobacteria bacterium]|nr:OadG family protein [Gammaproteobacteria bacterium]